MKTKNPFKRRDAEKRREKTSALLHLKKFVEN
jgi:hypothetical protein